MAVFSAVWVHAQDTSVISHEHRAYHEFSAGLNYSVVVADSRSVESWSLKRQAEPYLSYTLFLNKLILKRLIPIVSFSYISQQVHFSANVRDQAYSGYIQQRVGNKITEGYVEDAYFTGHTEGYYRLQYLMLSFQVYDKVIGDFLYIRAGFYGGYLLYGSNEVLARGTVALGPGLPAISTEFERTQNYSGNLKSYDFGLNGSFEGRIFSKMKLFLEFKYGIPSIYTPGKNVPSGSFNSSVLILGLRYALQNQSALNAKLQSPDWFGRKRRYFP